MMLFTIIVIILVVFLLLFLWAVMPRMIHRPEYSQLFGVYYAHRGLHDNKTDAPENSMKAFKKAVDAGYGIELDVQLTKDDIAVVFHDESLERVCGVEGMVHDYTFEQLQQFPLLGTKERIPTFESFLNLVDGKVPLVVEIKMHNANTHVCEKADELLQNYKGIYCMESFHPFAVRWYKKNRPTVIRGQLSSAFGGEGNDKETLDKFVVHHLLLNFLARPDFIAYNHKFSKTLSRNICKNLFHCLNVAWTIRSEEELKQARLNFDLFIFEGFIPKE